MKFTVRSVGAALAMLSFGSSSAILVSGCKKTSGDDGGYGADAVARVIGFKDRMCACRDKDCATKVNDDYTKWGTEMASKMASSKDSGRPDEALAKKLTEVAMAYGECMTRAMQASYNEPPPVDAAPPAPPPPTDEFTPFAPRSPIDADLAARAARDWGQAKRNVAPSLVELEFVDDGGILQDGGSISVFFSNEIPDDPKRKTGMPIRKSPGATGCFALVLKDGTWMNNPASDCKPGFRSQIRCTTKDVFAKAVADKMPADAAASMELHGTTKLEWEVTVEDEPRNVHFNKTYPDDCPLAVER